MMAKLSLKMAYKTAFCLGVCSLGSLPSAIAQVTSDGTLTTKVTSSNAADFVIEDGSRPNGGSNLFHSFGVFSIPSGGSVSFQNPVDVLNIIGRVTGGDVSTIDGLIETQGNTNLFLLNPAGFVFGENAELDINGSFFASTAESLSLKDGSLFSALETTTTPLLTVSAPVGLQLGNSPGTINLNEAELSNDGQTFGLVGGNITLTEATIEAPGGRVELFAANNAFVPITIVNGQLALGTQPAVGEWRDISLLDDADIRNEGNGRGAVQLQGRRILIQDRSRIRVINEGFSIDTGDIDIYGSEEIAVVGTSSSGSRTLVFSEVDEDSSGNASGGDVNINTPRFLILDGARVAAETESAGTGGNININANYVELSGIGPDDDYSYIRSVVDDKSSATGQGGDVVIRTDHLLLDDGATIRVYSDGEGDAGTLDIVSTGDVILQGTRDSGNGADIVTEANGSGRGGNVVIQSDRLLLRDGALFDLDTELDARGGDLTVQAELVSLSGINGRGFGSRLSTEVDDEAVSASAQGGDITIETDRLELSDGALIDAITKDAGDAGNINITANTIDINGAVESPRGAITSINSGVVDNVAGSGGVIAITVGVLNLKEGGTLSTGTEGAGDGGSIQVVADTINISGQSPSGQRSGITGGVTTGATGQGGQISVQSEQLFLSNGGQITTRTDGENNAGSITLRVADSLVLESESSLNSGVTANAVGDGGDIEIQANAIALNDAQITASNESNGGRAGNITITTEENLVSTRSRIAASTARGDGGNLIVEIGKALLLRDNTLLSATAGQAGGGGDGGNISIAASVIVAIASENSDIIANAFEGEGGNINLTTNRLLGLTFREALTAESDITASSQQGVSGVVNIEEVVVATDAGLTTLPEGLADSSDQIAQGCSATAGNTFTASGRGGIPLNPTQHVNNTRPWIDTRSLLTETLSATPSPAEDAANDSVRASSTADYAPETASFIEVTGWQVDPVNGQVELVATASGNVNYSASANCSSSPNPTPS
ncbi:MAG: filamentous hemagglutinin N-terminal domain-containing protein [Cyanobacteria bacterium J06621_11]